MNKIKAIPVLLTSIVLSACGGSDGDDGDSYKQTSISPSSYIDGEFKSASVTGVNFWQQSPNAHPLESGSCSDSNIDRYYETENIIVLGSNQLPEDDFKWGATLGEKSLLSGLKSFNLTFDQYVNLKSSVSLRAISRFNDVTSFINFDNPSDPINGSDRFDVLFSTYLDGTNGKADWNDIKNLKTSGYSSDSELAHQQIRNSLHKLTKEDEIKFITDFLAYEASLRQLPEELIEPLTIEQTPKMVLCLKDHSSMYGWGEGKRFGFEVSAKSAIQRRDDIQIATHEMIHHLQLSISSPANGAIIMERWFAEGQAVVLSGMKIAHGENGRNPLNVITFNDVQNEYASMPENEYLDYGQAYKWMTDKFGVDSGKTILYGMRDDDENIKYYEGSDNSFSSFEEQFNKLVDPNCTYDCGYTLEQYRDDYPNQIR